jgi:hypothetical protein
MNGRVVEDAVTHFGSLAKIANLFSPFCSFEIERAHLAGAVARLTKPSHPNREIPGVHRIPFPQLVNGTIFLCYAFKKRCQSRQKKNPGIFHHRAHCYAALRLL